MTLFLGLYFMTRKIEKIPSYCNNSYLILHYSICERNHINFANTMAKKVLPMVWFLCIKAQKLRSCLCVQIIVQLELFSIEKFIGCKRKNIYRWNLPSLQSLKTKKFLTYIIKAKAKK